MELEFKLQDILRGKLPLQQINRVVFDVVSITLFVGQDNIDDILENKLPYDEDGLYQDISRISNNNINNENRIVNEMVMELLHDLEGQDISPECNYELFKAVCDAEENELVSIAKNIDAFPEYVIKYMSEFSLSDIPWINKLVIEILKTHKGNTLYNTDCGNGTFIRMAYDEGITQSIIGNTYSRANYLISRVRSYIINRESITIDDDGFFERVGMKKADMIYAAYPFMLKYEVEEVQPMIDAWETMPLTQNRKYSSNMLCLMNILNILSYTGIAVTLIPDGGLYNSIDTEIREYIVRSNYLDAVISLPSGIIPSVMASASLLVLRKDRNYSDNVMMIDASEICTKERRRIVFTEENIHQIISLYKDKKITKDCMEVEVEEIIENNYYLGISRYMEIGVTLINPCSLDSVCKDIFRGYQLKAADLDKIITDDKDLTDYRIINVSDIQPEGYISPYLKAINVDDPKRYDKFCVEDGDIIITAKNTVVKTAVYRQVDNIKAVLTGNLIAIRLNKKKINPYFFQAFLNSESGKAMIKSIQTGTTVVSINPNSLKEMRISFLDMKEQNEIADEFIKKINEIETLLEKYAVLSDELEHLCDFSIRLTI